VRSFFTPTWECFGGGYIIFLGSLPICPFDGVTIVCTMLESWGIFGASLSYLVRRLEERAFGGNRVISAMSLLSLLPTASKWKGAEVRFDSGSASWPFNLLAS